MSETNDTTETDPLAAFRALPWWKRVRTPAVLFVLSFGILAALAGPRIKQASEHNHFVYLADSYLHGTLEMRETPPHGNDWASYEVLELQSGQVLEGNWYNRGQRKFMDLHGNLYILDWSETRGSTSERRYFVSFPPMPAVLMLPGVAIWGMDFNDVLFTVLFAALNIGLFYWLLRWLALTGRTKRSPSDNIWLTILFGFGTAHVWCSVLGQVWFTALVVGVTFGILYLRYAIDAENPLLAGLFLGCGFAARTPMLMAAFIFAWFLFFPDGKLRREYGVEFFKKVALFGVFPLIIGVTLMYANHVRFDSWTEFGHSYLAMGQNERIKNYGLFNIHFLTRNLTAMFTLLPKFQPEAPFVVVSQHGLALWFTTPAFLYLLWPRIPSEDRAQRLRHRALWTSVFLIFVMHALYQNTGWAQFSFRFQMDYIAMVTVLLAIGGRPLNGWFKWWVLVGVAINLFGAITFQRMGQFYDGFFIEAAPL